MMSNLLARMALAGEARGVRAARRHPAPASPAGRCSACLIPRLGIETSFSQACQGTWLQGVDAIMMIMMGQGLRLGGLSKNERSDMVRCSFHSRARPLLRLAQAKSSTPE
eukprot:3171296-Rhodomonas_salina.4